MSTEDYQDYATSRAWQRNAADELIAGKGVVVVEFFDRGCSRRLGWPDRPEAGVLLTALAHPDRGFDAVVVGEYERAFFGDQLTVLPACTGRIGGADTKHSPVDDGETASTPLICDGGGGPCGHVDRSKH